MGEEAAAALTRGITLLSTAKNEADRRLERYEIKRRLTRKVGTPPPQRLPAVESYTNPPSPPPPGLAVAEADGG